MKYTFLESQALLYPGFRDAETGRTLFAEPGGAYDVLPDVPPDGRWVLAEEQTATGVLPRVRTYRTKLAEAAEVPADTDEPETGSAGEGEEA